MKGSEQFNIYPICPPITQLDLVNECIPNHSIMHYFSGYGQRNIEKARQLISLIKKTNNHISNNCLFSSFLSFDLLLSPSNLSKYFFRDLHLMNCEGDSTIFSICSMYSALGNLKSNFEINLNFKFIQVSRMFEKHLNPDLSPESRDQLTVLFNHAFGHSIDKLHATNSCLFSFNSFDSEDLSFFDESILISALSYIYFNKSFNRGNITVEIDPLLLIDGMNAIKNLIRECFLLSFRHYIKFGGVLYSYLKLVNLFQACKSSVLYKFDYTDLNGERDKAFYLDNIVCPFIYISDTFSAEKKHTLSLVSSNDVFSKCIHDLYMNNGSIKDIVGEVLDDVFSSDYDVQNGDIKRRLSFYGEIISFIKDSLFNTNVSLRTLSIESLNVNDIVHLDMSVFRYSLGVNLGHSWSLEEHCIVDVLRFCLAMEQKKFEAGIKENQIVEQRLKAFFESLSTSKEHISNERLLLFLKYIQKHCCVSFINEILIKDIFEKIYEDLNKEMITPKEAERLSLCISLVIFYLFPNVDENLENMILKLYEIFTYSKFKYLKNKNIKLDTYKYLNVLTFTLLVFVILFSFLKKIMFAGLFLIIAILIFILNLFQINKNKKTMQKNYPFLLLPNEY